MAMCDFGRLGNGDDLNGSTRYFLTLSDLIKTRTKWIGTGDSDNKGLIILGERIGWPFDVLGELVKKSSFDIVFAVDNYGLSKRSAAATLDQ
ncbi:hypothetical protein Pan181_14450 [Aeoliella mucimassa]|uniref:Uncharacterized protein n=1 Tax=Aeoliella mucimassa TaxID=2527972 RepID=A0A518AKJ5_9BACT|nr:hypothetical protein Pan181_14450 [Aeoliella mucimassa]